MSAPGCHVIIGLGRSGFSVARHFLKQGIPFVVNDKRAMTPYVAKLKTMAPQIDLVLGHYHQPYLDALGPIVLTPGVDVRLPCFRQARNSGAIINDIELFARQRTAPLLAITGSNGKTTVTRLVTQMLEKAGCCVAEGGNIGIPALDLLEANKTEVYVLELSSYQLEYSCSLQADVATILNISPDHMDQYDRYTDYSAAKHRIYAGAKCVVLNLEDQSTVNDNIGAPRTISYALGSSKGADFYCDGDGDARAYYFQGKKLVDTRSFNLQGRHHELNHMAALAICQAYGISPFDVIEVAQSFEGLAHRCQQICTVNQVRWVNDSKGTNVGATIAAIDLMRSNTPGRLWLLAGGIAKGADFTPLRSVAKSSLAGVFVFGASKDTISHCLAGTSKVVQVADLMAGVEAIHGCVAPGDTVLFSPMCASFDMFKDYQARGDAFVQAVERVVWC